MKYVLSNLNINFISAFGINSILYQRGVYPPESFTRTQKYGLSLFVTSDDELNKYLNAVISQVKEWLYSMTVKKLVVVIKDVDSNEVLERWQFDVENDKTISKENGPKEKSEKQINSEIASVIRQITASITFLPLLEGPCSFDVLVYTDKDIDVPESWGENGPCLIENSEEVRLRSFSTTIHKVDAMVAFKKT
ncbi:hypothetical protein FSP39_000332 [Pinctada imbricata]|uniref:Mitotic spindle assembly checkpoint protein MAD2A n=1 Tax=Pinctada imbricata TaxID=66713 RepID=A0AA89BVK0_PINIB|nr:hypothetical protein FSP39_000332 [Pinctada imbricata]